MSRPTPHHEKMTTSDSMGETTFTLRWIKVVAVKVFGSFVVERMDEETLET
jgi:hypothetical protein